MKLAPYLGEDWVIGVKKTMGPLGLITFTVHLCDDVFLLIFGC